MTTNVVVVSPLVTVRSGLAALLERAGDVSVVGEAPSLEAAGLPELIPDADVVLIDAPSEEAVEDALARLNGLGLALLVLGSAGGARTISTHAPSLAWGYLAREAPADRIVAALRAVTSGLIVIDADLAADALVHHEETEPMSQTSLPDGLTSREQEVLSLVALGLTNKAIAQRLAISDHTVKFHVAAVLAKLHAESRTEAVHVALRRGLLSV